MWIEERDGFYKAGCLPKQVFLSGLFQLQLMLSCSTYLESLTSFVEAELFGTAVLSPNAESRPNSKHIDNMFISWAIVLVLQAANLAFAASTPCKRDACYNGVALDGPQSPKMASRKAGCRMVLKTAVDDDVTITIVRTATVISATVTDTVVDATFTVTTGGPRTVLTTAAKKKRRLARVTAAPDSRDDAALLEERDKVRSKGSQPSSCAFS